MSNRIVAVAEESNSTSCPPKFLSSCRRLGKKPRTPRPLDGGKGMSSSSASAVPPEDDVCSVCHDRFRIPCQANCSHWFCGSSPNLPSPLPPPPPARFLEPRSTCFHRLGWEIMRNCRFSFDSGRFFLASAGYRNGLYWLELTRML